MHNIRPIIFMYWLVFASICALIIRAIFEISRIVGVAENVSDRNTDVNRSVPGGVRRIVDGFCNFNEMFQNFTAILPVFPKINIDRFGSEDIDRRTTNYLRAKKDL